jgi:hypothetical protein
MDTTTEAQDRADAAARNLDQASQKATDFGLFHLLTFGSIGLSIYLFLSGKKQEGIFVGLWAPTFEALRSSFKKE